MEKESGGNMYLAVELSGEVLPFGTISCRMRNRPILRIISV